MFLNTIDVICMPAYGSSPWALQCPWEPALTLISRAACDSSAGPQPRAGSTCAAAAAGWAAEGARTVSPFSRSAPPARSAPPERRYVSSPLEQTWLSAAAKLKAEGNGNIAKLEPYCALLSETAPALQKMLRYIAALMAANSTSLSAEPDADSVLSYFETTMQCGPYNVTHKEHIESLVAALRHPFSIQCPASFTSLPPATDHMDRGYLLLASWRGSVQASRNRFYLDAGGGVGYKANPNQWWMLETYAARGIEFDRSIYWEARDASGSQHVADVPGFLFPAFTLYNIPAPASLDDPRNPLHVVTRLARPEDFVAVKLDIDASDIEDAWLRAILADGPTGQTRSRYATLIDELFWEHHFDLVPLKQCCWGDKVDNSSQLVDSMRLFVALRQLGIRAHYWM